MKNIFIIIILIAFVSTACFAEENNIIVLDQYNNKTYSEMLEELGSPINKTGYTIKNAPTKSWNHHELFSKYPKIPKNDNIHIMEVAWDTDDYLIVACYHMVDGENRCSSSKENEEDYSILKQITTHSTVL